MTTLAEAFPKRPLAVRQPYALWRGLLMGAVGVLIIAGGGLWLGQKMAPDLLGDFALRGTAQPVPGGRLVSGRCSSKLMLIHDCTLTLSVRGKDGVVTREVHYLFVDPHTGSYTVEQILGDPARPETLTTDIGMDRLWNRAITLVVMAGLMLVIGLGSLVLARGGARQRRLVRALSGKVLTPAVLYLESEGQRGWTVREPSGTARHDWKVAGNVQPFWLDRDRRLLLGVRAEGIPTAMPIDARLRWLGLAAEERAALQAFRANA
jgi:hypothetical protein